MSQKEQPPSLARGFMLGLPFFAVLVVAALIVYLIAGALGWSGRSQIVAAMCVGPLVGAVLLAVIVAAFKPKLIG